MYVHSNYCDYVILGSFASTEDEIYLESTENRGSYAGTQSSSSNQIKSREIIAWILVIILSVLLIVSLSSMCYKGYGHAEEAIGRIHLQIAQ